jgi:hypothetical protein
MAGLLAPIKPDITGPVCLTCNRVLDYEEMVEGYPGQTTHCRVLARHHGAEELRTFEFDSVEWDHRDLKRQMMGQRWFEPSEHGEGTLRETVPAEVTITEEGQQRLPANGPPLTVPDDSSTLAGGG